MVGAPAISATISKVEIINVRTQYVNVDDEVNYSNIDAELFSGVQQYWDYQQPRRPADRRCTPVAGRTDLRHASDRPGYVNYRVYFDPAQLAADRGTAGDSSLTLTMIQRSTRPPSWPASLSAASPSPWTVSNIVLNRPPLMAAQTYAEFVDAMRLTGRNPGTGRSSRHREARATRHPDRSGRCHFRHARILLGRQPGPPAGQSELEPDRWRRRDQQ